MSDFMAALHIVMCRLKWEPIFRVCAFVFYTQESMIARMCICTYRLNIRYTLSDRNGNNKNYFLQYAKIYSARSIVFNLGASYFIIFRKFYIYRRQVNNICIYSSSNIFFLIKAISNCYVYLGKLMCFRYTYLCCKIR